MCVALSIIIPAYSEEGYIKDCIQHIRTAMAGYSYEIIVVDNGSLDNTIGVLRDVPPDMLLFEPLKGVVRARQRGLDHASGHFVAFIDADARMPMGWWQAARQHFHDAKVAAVSGALQFYDGSHVLNQLAARFYTVAKLLHRHWPTLQGGNCVIRRTALVDGLDVEYNFWGEDTAMAKTVAKHGTIVLDPHLVMFTSARRLNRAGTMRTVGMYVLNYLSVSLLGRPTTKQYQDYR